MHNTMFFYSSVRLILFISSIKFSEAKLFLSPKQHEVLHIRLTFHSLNMQSLTTTTEDTI